MNLNISVAVVDDHKVVRSSLMGIISQFERVKQVHETQFGGSLLTLLATVPIDVAVLDVRITDTEGERACLVLSKYHSRVKIIILSMSEDREMVRRLLQSGAHGFIGRHASIDDVQRAIYGVLDTGFHYNDAVLRTIKAPTRKCAGAFNLSDREIEVINLICHELTMAEIAQRLHISEKTVQNHRSNIMVKLRVSNTAGLVRFAMKYNLVRDEEVGEFSYPPVPDQVSPSIKRVS